MIEHTFLKKKKEGWELGGWISKNFIKYQSRLNSIP